MALLISLLLLPSKEVSWILAISDFCGRLVRKNYQLQCPRYVEGQIQMEMQHIQVGAKQREVVDGFCYPGYMLRGKKRSRSINQSEDKLCKKKL